MKRSLNFQRILAIFVACSVFVTVFIHCTIPAAASDAEYAVLRDKWTAYLTGGDYETADEISSTVQNRVQKIESSASDLLSSMAPVADFYKLDYIWANRKVGDAMDMTVRSARNLSYNFEHLETLALAYKTKGSRYEGNKLVAEKIIAGLNFMYDTKYNENIPRSDRKNSNDNWYEWEIRAPEAIENTLVLMYDVIDQELIDKLQKGIDKQVPGIGTAATGANRLDNCQAAIIGGIVQQNPARLKMGTDALATELVYSTIDDGFYKDGSFIQHHQYPYNGAYGASALLSIARILYLFDGTSFMSYLPDLRNAYQWVYDSFEPLQYEGKMMDSVRGRSISGVGDKGYSILESLVLLSVNAPAPNNVYYKALVKRFSTNNTTVNPYSQMSSVYTISELYKILSDPSVMPREDQTFYKNFGAMDRAVSARENYTFNISMYSDRIRNYESINGANLQGWHTAAGMTYLFNDEITQYDDSFWPTVDRHRLSGTTVVKGSESASALYGNSFAGGVGIDGQYGINAMLYTAPDDAKGNHDLNAQKAWFMFDDEVVALGSGITSTMENDAVETIIDNRRIEKSTQKFSVNGTPLQTTLGLGIQYEDANWAHLEGNPAKTVNKKNTDIGYYFPNGCTLQTLRESRTDSWKSIGTGSSSPITRNYISLAVDHQKKPVNDTYSYVILPGKTENETKTYVQNPDIEIIENDENLQVVKENNLNITGAAVWNDKGHTFENITCYNKATMMIKETEDTIKISVSDPTQSQKVIAFDILAPVQSIHSMDNGMCVTKQGNATKVMVNVTNCMGEAFTIEFNKKASVPVPETPTGLSATAITPGAITLTWNTTENDKLYYPVFSESENGIYAPVPNYNGTDNTYIHQKLNAQKTYYYKLAVGDGTGISEYCSPVSATTPAPPSTPGAVRKFSESFEDCFVGPLQYQTDFTVTFGNDERNDAQIIEDETGNKLLKLTANARDTNNANISLSRKLNRLNTNFVVEGDFTMLDDSWKNLVLLSSNNTIAVQIYASEGQLHTYNGSSYLTKHPFKNFTYEKGVPFHLRVEVDLTNQMSKVFVNGTELEYSVDEPLTFRNRVTYIDKYECSVGNGRGQFLVDNLSLGSEIKPIGIEVVDLNNVPVEKITKGGQYTVKPRYQNYGAETEAVCIVVLKKGDQVLDTYTFPKTIPENNTTTPRLKIEIDPQFNFQNVYLECYLWETVENMVPLTVPIQFGK